MKLSLVSAAVLLAAPLAAQSPAPFRPTQPVADSLVRVVRTLFDGMRAHDTTMVRSVFVPGAQFSRPPAAGRPHRFTTVDQFVAAVGRPDEPWDEKFYDPEIREDAGMATMWTFFTFHRGTEFSHCGVNAIQLVRTSEGWKISGLADSSRNTGCEVTGRVEAR
jgi:hypothetical protein